jgi:hypothetical protein
VESRLGMPRNRTDVGPKRDIPKGKDESVFNPNSIGCTTSSIWVPNCGACRTATTLCRINLPKSGARMDTVRRRKRCQSNCTV